MGTNLADLHLRPYQPEDAEATLRIFERAVSITALSRYTSGEVAAWLGGPRDKGAWAADREAASTFVAERAGTVIGFSDLFDDGYVDRLFVDPDHGRQGVGRMLLKRVVDEAAQRELPSMTTHASLVARPVFEAAGFTVVHPETVMKDGERLERFYMSKEMDRSHQGIGS